MELWPYLWVTRGTYSSRDVHTVTSILYECPEGLFFSLKMFPRGIPRSEGHNNHLWGKTAPRRNAFCSHGYKRLCRVYPARAHEVRVHFSFAVMLLMVSLLIVLVMPFALVINCVSKGHLIYVALLV